MKWFRNLPIKQKISLVVLVSCTSAMLVASVILFAYQVFSFRQGFVHDMDSTAEMVGNSCLAAISFHDSAAGKQVLEVLDVKPQIVSSRVELMDGSVFAEYGKPMTRQERAQFPIRSEFSFEGNILLYAHPIMMNGQRLGTCLLRADYGHIFKDLLTVYIGILLAVLLIATALGLGPVLAPAAVHHQAYSKVGEHQQADRGEPGLFGAGAQGGQR